MGTKTVMARLAELAGLQRGIEEGGVFRELTGIFTAAEPVDADLYRSLLPAPFAMPARPLVGFFAIDYVKVYPWPVTPYKEGMRIPETTDHPPRIDAAARPFH